MLEDHGEQLDALFNTLRLIEEDKGLQTARVIEQVAKVHKIAQELEDFLGEMAKRQTKSATRQYIHAMASGKRNENEIVGILDRLDRTKHELGIRIQVAQVGITGTLRDGFVAVLPTIQRTDLNVQRVLGARLSVAARLEERRSSVTGAQTAGPFSGKI